MKNKILRDQEKISMGVYNSKFMKNSDCDHILYEVDEGVYAKLRPKKEDIHLLCSHGPTETETNLMCNLLKPVYKKAEKDDYLSYQIRQITRNGELDFEELNRQYYMK